MRLKSAARTSDSPSPEVTPEVMPDVMPDTVDLSDQPRTVAATESATTPAPTESSPPAETRSERLRRKAHRTRLQGYAFLAVALLVFLIALAVSNTDRVRVSWVFGSSNVALVWLIVGAAILGWLLGVVTTSAFHWRTRAPRR